MPLLQSFDCPKYISENVKNVSRKVSGTAIYLPSRFKRYDDVERFSSALQDLNLKEYIEENKLKLHDMNLIDKDPVLGGNLEINPEVIQAGTIPDILNFIKEKVREISPELFEKIKQLPQEALTSLKKVYQVMACNVKILNQ